MVVMPPELEVISEQEPLSNPSALAVIAGRRSVLIGSK